MDCVVTLRAPFARPQAAALAREVGALFDQLVARTAT